MSTDKKPIYRCPHCLSIKVEQKHFGHECPSCFKQIPVGLTPEYYVTNGKTNSFSKIKSTLGKRPAFVKVAIALILATAGITAYLDSSKNPQRDLSRIAEGIIPLGSIFQKRLEFEDISNCFDMLKYLQQEGWSMYTYIPFSNWQDIGSVVNVSSRSELATSLANRIKTDSNTQNIDPSALGIDCSESDIYKEKTSLAKPIAYDDFRKDLENKKISHVEITPDRQVALATYLDSKSFMVNLNPERGLLRILENSGASFEVMKTVDPIKSCLNANRVKIGLFFSGNEKEFNRIVNTLLYVGTPPWGPPWFNKFTQEENPKSCGFNLPAKYLSQGVSSNSYGFFAKISKLTDGSVQFSSSL